MTRLSFLDGGFGGFGGLGLYRPRAPVIPEPMLEEAEQGLGSKVYGLLTGLFNVLDLPGSVVRDLVTGNNPIDQFLSPTTQKNRASFIPEGSGLTDPGFYGGLAGEILLDPLTYLTLGASATTKVGRAAGKLGHLDDAAKIASQKLGRDVGRREALVSLTAADLGENALRQIAARTGLDAAEVAGQRLGTAGRFKLPDLVGGAELGFGTGERGMAFNRGLDVMGHAIRTSAVGRGTQQLFNPLARNFSKAGEQALAAEATRAERAAEATPRGIAASVRAEAVAAGIDEKQLRRFFEGVETVPDTAPASFKASFQRVQDYKTDVLARAQVNGNTMSELEDLTGALFHPRRFHYDKGRGGLGRLSDEFQHFAAMAKGRGWGRLKEFNPHEVMRAKPFRNIEGATEQLNEIFADEDINNLLLQGRGKEEVAAVIRQKYKNAVPETFTTESGELVDQREALADFITKLTPAERAAGYGAEPVRDLRIYGEHMEGMLATQDWAFSRMAEMQGQAGTKSIDQVLTAMGLKRGDMKAPGAIDQIAKQLPQEVRDAIEASFVPPGPRTGKNGRTLQPTAKAIAKAKDKHFRKSIAELTLPDELTNVIEGLHNVYRKPDAANGVTNWFDSITNWFKNTVTTPWPAFHTRNLYGGQFVNWVSGFYDPNPAKAFKAWKEINDFATGASKIIPSAKSLPAVKDILKARNLPLDDDHATRVLQELEFQYDVTHRESLRAPEQLAIQAQNAPAPTGGGAANATDLTAAPIVSREDKVLGEKAFPTVGEIARTWAGLEPGVSWHPREFIKGVRGVGDNRVTTLAPAAAGELASTKVELFNRMLPFIELQKKGYSPAKAAEMVKAAQVDYSSRSFTDFERNTLKKAFPFYSWSSRMIPFTVRSMIDKPQLRSVVRAQERATESQGEFIPDRYRRQPAILLGNQNELGYQSVLSQLDLAHNAALEPFMVGPTLGGTLERTGRGIAGNLHPALKWLVEQGMGTSTFTGRNVEDLEGGLSTIARNIGGQAGVDTPKLPQPIDNALLSLGLSRPAAVVRAATDPRTSGLGRLGDTALTLLTGARMATYDPANEASRAFGEVLREEGMSGRNIREYNRIYVPKDRKASLTPDEQLDMLIHNAMQERSRAAHDRRILIQAQEAVAP